MRSCAGLLLVALVAIGCGSPSGQDAGEDPAAAESTASSTTAPEASTSAEKGPGGYGFDRGDPESGIANIMDAFATDEATATCLYEAWGDVANVPPAELTPALMTFEICGTSIFELITGDPRFTGNDEP